MDKKENTIKYFMKASENEELFTTIAMEECAELIQAISKANWMLTTWQRK